MRSYYRMKQRIGGKYIIYKLYVGMEILSKDDFYKWGLENPEFTELFIQWRKYNYNRKYTPTVNRINPLKGYILGNMEWLTHSENSRLGGINGGRLHNGKKSWATRLAKKTVGQNSPQ
jgi:hypothetical protein